MNINLLVPLFYLQSKRSIRVREKRETNHAEETTTTDIEIEVLLTGATEIQNIGVTVTR